MAEKLNIYFDSCIWIRLIQQEDGVDNVIYAIERAKDRQIQIWTSALVLAEVYKTKCGAIAAINDVVFEEYIEQDFVERAMIDYDIAKRGRLLCRQFQDQGLKKPADGIHLATAVAWNCDALYTIDDTDLLPLSGMVNRKDGKPLLICVPPPRPAPDPGPLFRESST